MKAIKVSWVLFALSVSLVAVLCLANPLYDTSAIQQGDVREGKIQIANPAMITDVRGNWTFFRGQFINSPETGLPDGFARLPGSWRDAGVKASKGYASYGLQVFGLIPGKLYTLRIGQVFSACSVYANGMAIASSGIPGQKSTEEYPGWAPVLARFYPRSDGSADLVLRISNFHSRTGGTNSPIYLGESGLVNRLEERRKDSEAFVFSFLSVAGLLFLIQFFFSTGTKYFLWFSLALITAGLRSLCFDCLVLVDIFPAIPWSVYYRIANLTFPLLIIFSTGFLSQFYPQAITAKRFMVITYGYIALAILLIFLPEYVSSFVLVPAEIAATITIPVVFVFLLSTGMWKLPRGWIVCCAYLASMAFFLHDLLVSLWVIPGFRVGYFGEAIFLLSVALVEIDAYAESFDKVGDLTLQLQDINHSLSKFVPKEIIDLLGNNSRSDLEMAIMHVSVLSVPNAAERMDPSGFFAFLNECFIIISPIIREHGGFIARYNGGGLLAMFPQGPESALTCAVRMQSAIAGRNRSNPGKPRLTMGIGLDSGKISLGVIGAGETLDGAIISGCVRRVGLFEQTARKFSSKILISNSVFSELPDPLAWFIRPVDRLEIDGLPVFLFEVYNNDPDIVRNLKHQTQSDLEHMLYSYFSGRTDEACHFFVKANAVFPDDPVLHSFSRNLPIIK